MYKPTWIVEGEKTFFLSFKGYSGIFRIISDFVFIPQFPAELGILVGKYWPGKTEKTTNAWVRIIDLWAEIWTHHLPNTKRDKYSLEREIRSLSLTILYQIRT